MLRTFDFQRIPVVDVVNEILVDAAKRGASDIHFDPYEEYLLVRIRIDGDLLDYAEVPNSVRDYLVTRIKTISKMNITESRRPQDGAIKATLKGVDLDLRVSSLPVSNGEKIVIRILDYSMSMAGIDELGFSDENYKKELLKFIKTFDSGIEGIRTTPDSIEAVKNNNGIIDIEVLHRGENGEIKALPFYLESNGTRKMFHLFDFFMDALKNGMVLFVDELDAKLHPLLTRYIINLFHNSQTNIGNGQLIYSTHDTVNLNKETFRRDEIWFAEKDKDGISEIYALSDYILEDDKNAGKKVRNDATYNKDYLTGRYGAIPVLEEFNIIHEE